MRVPPIHILKGNLKSILSARDPVTPDTIQAKSTGGHYTFSENMFFSNYIYQGMTQAGDATIFDLPDYEGHFKNGTVRKNTTAATTFQTMLAYEFLHSAHTGVKLPQDAKQKTQNTIRIMEMVKYAARDTILLHTDMNGFPEQDPQTDKLDAPWDRLARHAGFSNYNEADFMLTGIKWDAMPSSGEFWTDVGNIFKPGQNASPHVLRLMSQFMANDLIGTIKNDLKVMQKIIDPTDEQKAFIARFPGFH